MATSGRCRAAGSTFAPDKPKRLVERGPDSCFRSARRQSERLVGPDRDECSSSGRTRSGPGRCPEMRRKRPGTLTNGFSTVILGASEFSYQDRVLDELTAVRERVESTGAGRRALPTVSRRPEGQPLRRPSPVRGRRRRLLHPRQGRHGPIPRRRRPTSASRRTGERAAPSPPDDD